jgi:hypothetical protein
MANRKLLQTLSMIYAYWKSDYVVYLCFGLTGPYSFQNDNGQAITIEEEHYFNMFHIFYAWNKHSISAWRLMAQARQCNSPQYL